MYSLVFMHKNYDYDQLCEEIDSIKREEDKSIVNFDLRLIKHSYKFCDDDQHMKRTILYMGLLLFVGTFMKLNKRCSLNIY